MLHFLIREVYMSIEDAVGVLIMGMIFGFLFAYALLGGLG